MNDLIRRSSVENAVNDVNLVVSNFGLFVDRYFFSNSNDRFIELFNKQLKNGIYQSDGLYQLAFSRWVNQFDFEKYLIKKSMEVKDRIVVGLGQESVNEIGLQVHHTYGVPYISGSSIKGAVAHYCNTFWGEYKNNSGFKTDGDSFQFIFGNQNESGFFEFHDAWLMPEYLKNAITLDIMTNHHSNYYQSNINENHLMDSDEPTPIHFFSVRGAFVFAITITQSVENSDEANKWLKLVERLLVETLTYNGIGGKTSTGYGRFVDLNVN